MDNDLQRTLGQIEQKIDDLRERLDRHGESHRGPDGIEFRLRTVEGDIREVKAKAGVIAFMVSLVMTIALWLVRLFNWR